jgi:hypothetical protein
VKQQQEGDIEFLRRWDDKEQQRRKRESLLFSGISTVLAPCAVATSISSADVYLRREAKDESNIIKNKSHIGRYDLC